MLSIGGASREFRGSLGGASGGGPRNSLGTGAPRAGGFSDRLPPRKAWDPPRLLLPRGGRPAGPPRPTRNKAQIPEADVRRNPVGTRKSNPGGSAGTSRPASRGPARAPRLPARDLLPCTRGRECPNWPLPNRPGRSSSPWMRRRSSSPWMRRRSSSPWMRRPRAPPPGGKGVATARRGGRGGGASPRRGVGAGETVAFRRCAVAYFLSRAGHGRGCGRPP